MLLVVITVACGPGHYCTGGVKKKYEPSAYQPHAGSLVCLGCLPDSSTLTMYLVQRDKQDAKTGYNEREARSI